MLNCPHHVQWVRRVPGGLHQCIQCFQVVTKKDIYPKYEDLTDEFRQRWDAHEATRPPPETAEQPAPPPDAKRAAAPAPKAPEAPAKPAPAARPAPEAATPPARPAPRAAPDAAAPPSTPAGPSGS